MKTNYLRNKTFNLVATTAILLANNVTTLQADETNIAIDQINIEDSSYSDYESREDLKLSSTKNLYRVEKTAQFGTEVITQEEIKAQNPKDIFDLLNKTAGLDVTYQGRKHPYFVNMRGGGNITYILDGAILTGTADRILVKLPMSAIEEIQIVKSSTSLTLAPSIDIGASNSGSGNSIGFIIIRTKQPKKTEGVISTYYEKSESHPSANGQNIYAGTTFAKSDDLSGFVGGMVSRYDRPSNNEWFDGSDAKSGMINAGFTYNKLKMNLMGYKDEGMFEFQKGVDKTGAISTVEWYYDPLKTTILSLDGNYAWNENQITLFSLSNSEYKHTEYTPNAKDYEEKTKTYSLRHNMTFDDTLIQLGGQITNSKGNGSNLSYSYNSYDTSVYGGAISIEQGLFDNSLILNAGYRIDQKKIDHSTSAKNQTSYNNLKDANNNSDLPEAKVLALGAMYNFDNIHSLSVRYLKANEGGGDFDLITNDGSELHEEKQDRFEVGIEGKYSKAFNPMITYFDVDIKNEKSVATDSSGNTLYYTDSSGNEYYYYNEEDTRRKGLEFAIKGTINGATTYKLSYTRMLDNTTDNEDSIGINTPRDLYTAMISHTWDSYTFNVSAKKVSDYTSSSSAMGTSTNGDLGDYIRVDANVSKDFKIFNFDSIFKLYGRNITDENYATRYTTGYYYDRGRVIGAELSLLF